MSEFSQMGFTLRIVMFPNTSFQVAGLTNVQSALWILENVDVEIGHEKSVFL